MDTYVKFNRIKQFPRIPLEGYLDLTYRCNCNCLHCWLRIPPNSPEKKKELTFNEIKSLVDKARSMGCQRWFISGGEPMLRSDFSQIFDYISSKSVLYSLNTNGTLITPEIARLMKRKGNKWIALYGANAEVYDQITRTPGSFDAAMRGFSLLKDAGVGFMVQVIVMKDNFHQYQKMIKLAKSLSPYWRTGSEWFYLSASQDPIKNQEIIAQRLDPKIILDIIKPSLSYEDNIEKKEQCLYNSLPDQENLFSSCIDYRRDFHIDPYGLMSFCNRIKDPSLRYDLRKGSFQDCWNNFIPSLAGRVKADEDYRQNCGSCELRSECGWCPVYAYLEKGSFTAKVDYLCKIEKESKRYKENWQLHHRRYFKLADLTVQVNADLPITKNTFLPIFKKFETSSQGNDIVINHHFSLPDLKDEDLGKEIYKKPPWAIYKKGNSWIYLGIDPDPEDKRIYQVAVFNYTHTRVRIYNQNKDYFSQGNLHALTLFPSDQILFARAMIAFNALYLHSSGVILEGYGLLFVGQSQAGKSTMVKILKNTAEILCDDRNIIRRKQSSYHIHGTWNHGEVPLVSSKFASLKGIFFLNKGKSNRIEIITNKNIIIQKILACLIKPFLTEEWWDKIFIFVKKLAGEIPCYNLFFDKSGEIKKVLEELILKGTKKQS